MIKVLVIEDDGFLASAYKSKLGKHGFEVRVAHDGVEGFSILEEFMPDAILLDLIMPNMDGFETLKKLKETPQFAQIPVIVSSNLAQKEDTDSALSMGAVDFIVKSDTPLADIVKQIEKVTGQQATEAA